MSSEKNLLAAVVREMVADERRAAGPSPVPDELADYVAGELSDEEAERIRDHLTIDPESRQVVQDLASFPDLEPPSEEYRISDRQLAAEWRTLAAELGLETPSESAAEGKVLPFSRPGRAPARHRWPLALAAALLLACLGLSFRVWQLSAPRTDVHIVQLVPGTERDGDQTLAQTVAIPPAADRVLWLLEVTAPTPYREHTLDVVDAEGRRIRSIPALQLNAEGFFTVSVAADYLPAGTCRLLLFGVADDGRKLVAWYRVRIEYR